MYILDFYVLEDPPENHFYLIDIRDFFIYYYLRNMYLVSIEF